MNNTARRLLIAMLALACVAQTHAGDGHEWETYLNDIALLEDGQGTSWEHNYDMLCDMEANPININAATRDELERLPFLSEGQVSDILEYVYRHGPVRTMGELQMIESLDYARRHLLQCFAYAGEPAGGDRPRLADIMKRGKSELTACLRVPLYDREGDRNGYLGYKYKHWVRYTFSGGDALKVGFTASQDAGEPFFAGRNALGYDFYSFYVRLKGIGRVETLVLGRYTVAFGMGLVANTGFSLGKAGMLANLGRAPAGISATSSRSAASYLQGMAATIRLGRDVRASVFASCRPHDATLNDDGTAATIVTSGYHRTIAEMAKKNNVYSTVGGLNVRASANGFHVGATAVYTHYSRDLRPNTATLYRRHYATGNDFVNVGVDYGYAGHSVEVGGETAVNRDGRVATVNSVGVRLSERASLTTLHRFYSFRYTAIHANSFSEGGRVQNEHGIYLGAEWRPVESLRIAAYADYAHFEWPRYRVSRSSAASDNMLSASYSARRWTFDARYRLHIRQRDNAAKTGLDTRAEHRARAAMTVNGGGAWSCRTQADLALAAGGASGRGFMVSESADARIGWLRLSLFAAYFNADNYDSRLYAYERGPLYSFSYPAFYGRGMRCSLMTRADIGDWLTVIVKCGVTGYFDRDTIGSGYRKVNAPSMTDIDMQAVWRF